MKRRQLVVTANFEKNLDVIEQFNDPPSDAVVDSLNEVSRVVPRLERLPDLGRELAVSNNLLSKVVDRLGGGTVRQVVAGEFIVLYLSSPSASHCSPSDIIANATSTSADALAR